MTPFVVGLVGFVVAIVCWTPALWLTVRVCDGSNDRNTFKASVGWSTLMNALLAVPYVATNVVSPDWLTPLTGVFVAVTLAAAAGVFWRFYDFSPTKSVVALPVFGVSLAVVVAVVGGLAIGAAVAISGPGAITDLRQTVESAAQGGPVELPAFELPIGEPPPEETPDLSEGVTAVKGMPGHYTYKDHKGQTHIVDDYNKVPEEYRR
jgi:hypothetical protein